jgi:hypothetical protein
MGIGVITHYSDHILIRRSVELSEGCLSHDMEFIPAREATGDVLKDLAFIRTAKSGGIEFDEWGDERIVKWYNSLSK